jgi:hypothetical protein
MVDGMGVLLKKDEDKDAIFGLPPHEAIAQNPLCRSPHHEKRRCQEDR